MRPGSGIEDHVELAKTWRQHLFSGSIDELDWLTTRTCQIDLRGSASNLEPLDRQALLDLARALGDGLSEVRWNVDRTLQREHQVVVDARLEARQTGPLDFTSLGGPRLPEADRRLELPRQRFSWYLVHKRIHEFEVVDGPGLGWEIIQDALELNPEVPSSARSLPDRSVQDAAEAIEASLHPTPSPASSNGHTANGNGTNGHERDGTDGSGPLSGKPTNREQPPRPLVDELSNPIGPDTEKASKGEPKDSEAASPNEPDDEDEADGETAEGSTGPALGDLEAKVDRVIDKHLD